MVITFTFILLALTILGIYLWVSVDIDCEICEILGIFLTATFGLCLIVSSYKLLTVSYHYDLYVVKRNAFIDTLKDIREGGNEHETEAVYRDILEANAELRVEQYDNGTFFYDQYIDDRIMDLKPIK